LAFSKDDDNALLCLDQKNLRFERLKLAVRDYSYDLEINWVVSFNAALQRLAEKRYAAIVVAPDLPKDDLEKFVSSLQSQPGGQDVAVIMIIEDQTGPEMEEQMSLGLLLGANGFLKDPFSTQGVKETLILSHALKNQRLESRQKKSVASSLRDARQLIDHAALLKQLNQGGDLKGPAINSIRAAIHKCVAENAALYYRLVVGSFVRFALMKRPLSSDMYTGKSQRVRRNIAGKKVSSPNEKSTL
jgi:CheY-like chemotaxis protein